MITRATNVTLTANYVLSLIYLSNPLLFSKLVQSFNKGRGYNQHINSTFTSLIDPFLIPPTSMILYDLPITCWFVQQAIV